MAGNVTLPKGFVLDEPVSVDAEVSLPAGFQLDNAPAQIPGAPAPVSDGSENVPEWGRKYPSLYGVAGAARETLGPIMEALGTVGGATLATGAALPTGPGAAMAGVAGAGLGYAGAKNLLESIDVALGNAKGKTAASQVRELPDEISSGMAMEAGGQVIGKGLGKGIEYVAKKFLKPAVTQTIGATTGAGPAAAEEALKGSKTFTEALRGKITGDEIVDNVRGALQTLKDARGSAYQESLSKIKTEKSLDISPILTKMQKLMQNYNIRQNADGTLDLSRVAMGKSGRADIQEIVETVSTWGKQKGDRTPIGLDTLKRQLDDFYSDSSQARQFVSALRGEVKNTIASNVPEYAKMTKGYEEATKMIKDVESALMLRKNGMSGRVTADNTLRRLTSAMREGFDMRKELLDALGKKAGDDLSAQVAGYSMNQIVPRGLVGKAFGGSAGVLAYLNPKLYPLLAASSPRAMGEFLSVYGKLGKRMGMFKPAAQYAVGAMAGKNLAENPPDLVSSAEAADYTGDLGGTLSARNRAMQDAASEGSGIVGATVSRASQPNYGSEVSQRVSSDRARFDAETRRMQAEQDARKRGAAPAKKAYIPVTQVTVQTRDGEELMWKDKKGKLYSYNPNGE